MNVGTWRYKCPTCHAQYRRVTKLCMVAGSETVVTVFPAKCSVGFFGCTQPSENLQLVSPRRFEEEVFRRFPKIEAIDYTPTWRSLR